MPSALINTFDSALIAKARDQVVHVLVEENKRIVHGHNDEYIDSFQRLPLENPRSSRSSRYSGTS